MLLTKQEQAAQVRQTIEEIGFREVLEIMSEIAQERADDYRANRNDWIIETWFQYYEKASRVLSNLLHY